MRYRPHITRSICLALLLSLGGCSSWFTSSYRDPEVHLVNVEVVKAKILEQRFLLRFSIDNPNSGSLRVRGLIYRVSLGGILLAEGEADDWFKVAGHSKEYYEIPIRTNLWEHLRDLAKILKHKDQPIPYLLQGELKTGLFFRRGLRLDRSGEIIPGKYIPE